MKSRATKDMCGRLPPEKEKRILEVAKRLILTNGFSELSIDKIAQEAGVSKSTIYRRFNNKTEIFEVLSIEMLQDFMDKINAVLVKVETKTTNPEQILLETAKVVHKAMRKPDHLYMLRDLLAEIPRNAHLKRWVKKEINPILPARLISFFSELIEKGQMEHPDPVTAAATFTTLASDGFNSLFETGGSEKQITARVETDVKAFIKGFSITGADKNK